MNLFVRACFIPLFLIFFAGINQDIIAQQSDFQIVRSYQTEYNAVMGQLQNIESLQDAEDVILRINQLEREFDEHASLINRFIYPDEFTAQISNLREISRAARAYLVRIGEQAETIEELTNQISELTSELERFSDETESLRSQLQSMTRDRNANRAMAQSLRRELDSRDDFILNLVDSLFVAYDNLDIASLTAAERQEMTLRADRENVVGHIQGIVESNIDFIDTHGDLSSEEFLRLRTVQQRFSESWGSLGTRLAEMYESSASQQEQVEQVNDLMTTWNNRIEQSVWRSLENSFANAGINLSSFNSSASFYAALNTHIDGAIQRTMEEGGSEEELSRYNTFAGIWFNDVKERWHAFIVEGRVLTFENMATIDRKLSDWNVNAQPPGPNYLLFVILLGLVVLILLVVVLTKASGTKPAK
ncbi:hypothetical protein CYPRO_1611 [Cyclonatronum proteinivorum]|uniref:Uncharacterized protein n=1 Tax=Cyclonatronum proteinivorum TaxID=1457365 RepID=A0A345UK60_9BACT|nr:hypothetical protein [Cyclonatronum proteinivorum]AXJ00862.1 hypothetical protein CYPRO_1611 [Cyclonatronum proteinivorum]